MICLQCGKEFEGRADAKYCSDKCRKVAFKRSSVERIDTEKERIISGTGTDKKLSVPGILEGVVRDQAFYDNLTGTQAQELLKEACKIDSRINPIQPDWAAISGARIRHKHGLPKPYRPPTKKDLQAIRAKLQSQLNQWEGVSASRGAA